MKLFEVIKVFLKKIENFSLNFILLGKSEHGASLDRVTEGVPKIR